MRLLNIFFISFLLLSSRLALAAEAVPSAPGLGLEAQGIYMSGWQTLVSSPAPEVGFASLTASSDALALTSGDFDEDGVADLISAFGTASAGWIAFQSGEVRFQYPRSQRQFQRPFSGQPFSPETRIVPVTQMPELIGAGDFNGDGHWDLVVSGPGSRILEFLLGDGTGDFPNREEYALPQKLTALLVADVNRRDGLRDLVLGVGTSEETGLYVLEGPRGVLSAEPEKITTSEPVFQIVAGQFDGEYPIDIAFVAGADLVILNGRDRQLTLPAHRRSVSDPILERHLLSGPGLALAVVDLVGDSRQELVALTAGGSLELFERPDGQEFQYRGELYDIGLDTEAAGLAVSQRFRLVPARLSGNPRQELIVLDRQLQGWRLLIPGRPSSKEDTSETPSFRFLTLAKEQATRAIEPLFLNGDALTDLVTLSRNPETIRFTTTEPAHEFKVDRSDMDADLLDDKCDIDLATVNEHECTLRAAILQSDFSAGSDLISFLVDKVTFTVIGSALQPVTIDGTTAPSGRVELDGMGVTQSGLGLFGGASLIRGVAIHSVQGSGVSLGHDSRVEGCYFGTDASGVTPKGIGNWGVQIGSNSNNNTIGGTAVEARNVFAGAELTGGIKIRSENNKVLGNRIGTDKGGLLDLGNEGSGIEVEGAMNTTIGGLEAGSDNLISGNGQHGVFIDESTGTMDGKGRSELGCG